LFIKKASTFLNNCILLNKLLKVKNNISKKITLLMLILLLIGSSLQAQRKFEMNKGGLIWRHWFVKSNIGLNAFFGDVSTYDHDPLNKLKYESKFGYSVSAGKWIIDWGGANFTFAGGSLKGIRENGTESHANFYQYTLEGLINITQLINHYDEQTPFYVYAKLGYGLIDFNAYSINSNTGDTLNIVGKHSGFGQRVTEWVIPLGIGGAYNIDKNFALIFDATYNYTHTDKLDARYYGSASGDNDYYIYAAVGVKYTFTIKDEYGKYRRPRSKRSRRWTR